MGFQLCQYAFYKNIDEEQRRERAIAKFLEDCPQLKNAPSPANMSDAKFELFKEDVAMLQRHFEERYANRVDRVADGFGIEWELHPDTMVVEVGYESKIAMSSGKPPRTIGSPIRWDQAQVGHAYMIPEHLEDLNRRYKGGAIKGGVAGFIAGKLLTRVLFK